MGPPSSSCLDHTEAQRDEKKIFLVGTSQENKGLNFVRAFNVSIMYIIILEPFSYDLGVKTRGQNRNNKRMEIARFDWFIEQIQTRVAFGWFIERSGEKKVHARELSRNQPILRFDVILEHDWLIEQCPLYIRIFFCGKTKRPSIDFSIHWLIKQVTNSY